MIYYIYYNHKERRSRHTTSANVCRLLEEEGYVLVSTCIGWNLSVRDVGGL